MSDWLTGVGDAVTRRRDVIRYRRSIRNDRLSLHPKFRHWIDNNAGRFWERGGRDPEAARELARTELQQLGIDPATILLIIQIVYAIYKMWKAINVETATPGMTTAMFWTADEESDEDD
jgi:hypothetical protein